jgi:hypothetical protein
MHSVHLPASPEPQLPIVPQPMIKLRATGVAGRKYTIRDVLAAEAPKDKNGQVPAGKLSPLQNILSNFGVELRCKIAGTCKSISNAVRDLNSAAKSSYESSKLARLVNTFHVGTIVRHPALNKSPSDYDSKTGLYKELFIVQSKSLSKDQLEIWSLKTKQIYAIIEFPRNIDFENENSIPQTNISWHLDNNLLFVQIESHVVLSYNLDTGLPHRYYFDADDPITQYYCQAGFLIGVTSQNAILVWNKSSGVLLAKNEIKTVKNNVTTWIDPNDHSKGKGLKKDEILKDIKSVWVDTPDKNCTDISKAVFYISDKFQKYKWNLEDCEGVTEENQNEPFKKVTSYGNIKVVQYSDKEAEVFVNNDSLVRSNKSNKILKVEVAYNRIAVLDSSGTLTVYLPEDNYKSSLLVKDVITQESNRLNEEIEFISPAIVLYISSDGKIKLINMEEKDDAKKVLRNNSISRYLGTSVKVRQCESQIVFLEPHPTVPSNKNIKILSCDSHPLPAEKKNEELENARKSQMLVRTKLPSKNLFSPNFKLPDPATNFLEVIINVVVEIFKFIGKILCGSLYAIGAIFGLNARVLTYVKNKIDEVVEPQAPPVRKGPKPLLVQEA